MYLFYEIITNLDPDHRIPLPATGHSGAQQCSHSFNGGDKLSSILIGSHINLGLI
jgi:hypothetical protein